MIDLEPYTPGPPSGAQVRKDGESWTLILVRQLRCTPEKASEALTDPGHLREWARFVTDGSLGTGGTHLAGNAHAARNKRDTSGRSQGARVQWHRLNAEHAKQFGVRTPKWQPRAAHNP
jgi:hypothetical protein